MARRRHHQPPEQAHLEVQVLELQHVQQREKLEMPHLETTHGRLSSPFLFHHVPIFPSTRTVVVCRGGFVTGRLLICPPSLFQVVWQGWIIVCPGGFDHLCFWRNCIYDAFVDKFLLCLRQNLHLLVLHLAVRGRPILALLSFSFDCLFLASTYPMGFLHLLHQIQAADCLHLAAIQDLDRIKFLPTSSISSLFASKLRIISGLLVLGWFGRYCALLTIMLARIGVSFWNFFFGTDSL